MPQFGTATALRTNKRDENDRRSLVSVLVPLLSFVGRTKINRSLKL